MNSYGDNINITASLEISRNCLRRIARHDEAEFSHQSILNAMETFVKTVNTMDETILVPCRLMDLKVGDDNDPTTTTACSKKHNQKSAKHTVQDLFNSVDLFQIYNMLNSVKADLLWGQGQAAEEPVSSATATNNNNSRADTATTTNTTTTTSTTTATTTTTTVKGHVRRPSTVSVASTNSSNSSTMSDSESDAGNENDSGIEESQEGCFGDKTEQVAENFRRHLVGLTRSLRQMTEAAQYLTSRYQHDIGGPV